MNRAHCLPAGVLLAAFTVQNIEESLYLPDWAQAQLPTVFSVTQARFALATALLTAVAALATRLACHGKGRLPRLALALLAGALLANALSHIALSMFTRSLMPGALSGLLLQGPAAFWLLLQLKLTRPRIALATALGFVLVPLVALPALAIAALILN